jgi:glycosyltransferase involved in cell wall biosynthesis
VSIVIPVYNGADFLREAIDSALGQTYPNLEVLVVNDGSDDHGASAAIARSYAGRIRYFEKDNGGVATALNLGIAEMRGEYFSWLSHDDVYKPEKVATQIQLLEELENRDVVLYSDYDLIDERSRLLRTVRLDHDMLAAKPLYSVLRGSIHGCSTLVPRAAFERFGTFDPTLPTTQDYALWFKMARGLPFVHIPEPLVRSRWHTRQTSKTHPSTLFEANALWMGFMESLSAEEMLALEPTVFAFFQKLGRFLETTPYEQARQQAVSRAANERSRVRETLGEHKVSVVVPVSDRIPLAVESVQSAANQSHRNLEILVIANSCPEDLSPLKDLAERDSRITLVTSSQIGVSSARNLGVDMSTGDYIAFLDADDLWEPEKVAIQLCEMLLTGDPLGFTDYQTFGDAQVGVVDCRVPEPQYDNLVRSCPIATPTVMICRTTFGRGGFRFREDLHLGEDICLWLDVASKHRLHHCALPLTRVRAHHCSAARDPLKQAQGLLNIISHLTAHHDPIQLPLEVSHLLKATCWELEWLAVDRWLDFSRSTGKLWPDAPRTERLVRSFTARMSRVSGFRGLARNVTRRLIGPFSALARSERVLRRFRARVRARQE